MPTALTRRQQLTLFVPEPWRSRLDALRERLDPVQASLISAHVTLCREDEIDALDAQAIFERVESWPHGPVTLQFAEPVHFGGHGVLLPCHAGAAQFHRLRQWLLGDPNVRVHDAHLTLAHPRNARAVGNTDTALASCPSSLELHLPRVALIEQHGAERWRVVHERVLGVVAMGTE
jgi:2'-5' RNA ligase